MDKTKAKFVEMATDSKAVRHAAEEGAKDQNAMLAKYKNEQTKAKIQELCPDVMELKFGCEIICQQQFEGKPLGKRYGDTVVSVLQNGSLVLRYDSYHVKENEVSEILGSPITLAVVLRAIGIARQFDSSMRGSISPNGCWYENGKVMAQWNLEHDNYDAQSDETKAFIGNLLGV